MTVDGNNEHCGACGVLSNPSWHDCDCKRAIRQEEDKQRRYVQFLEDTIDSIVNHLRSALWNTCPDDCSSVDECRESHLCARNDLLNKPLQEYLKRK